MRSGYYCAPLDLSERQDMIHIVSGGNDVVLKASGRP